MNKNRIETGTNDVVNAHTCLKMISHNQGGFKQIERFYENVFKQ